VLRDGHPVWASACTGNVHYETLQRMASVLIYGFDLAAAQRAASLLTPQFLGAYRTLVEQVFSGEFDPQVIQAFQDKGQPVTEIPLTFNSFVFARGVLAAISIDSKTGILTGAVPVMLGGSIEGY
jgi:hypothetical protein